jgi:hypothetical protein
MKQITGIVLSVLLALWTIGCGEGNSPDGTVAESAQANGAPSPVEPASVEPVPAHAPAVAVDKSKIAGTWARADAPYQLVISDIMEDGTMKAAYLNPNPINVSKAGWVDGKGVISLFVELQDVNYPGSKYTLTYLPDPDMLVGKYFQAVQGVTYDVAFSRTK